MLRFGYNTNGFAHHRLEDVLPILAELGYESVAITLDHYALNPFDKDLNRQMGEVRHWLERLRLKCVIETGSRYLLDRKRKHQPTLVSPTAWEREYRLEYLKRAVWIAEALGADCVSFWSGTPVDDAPIEELWQRLTDGCRALCDVAEKHNMELAFEPEPGMLIDTTAKYVDLVGRVQSPRFRLTLDIGHVHCQAEPIVETIQALRAQLRNIHLEDMRRGVHEHLKFGEGEIDFPPILRALQDIGYDGGVHVELSRHSHDVVIVAGKAIRFLRECMSRR
jgi:sugar phosphate isomerase/epimerase